jgi:hypothetical protein
MSQAGASNTGLIPVGAVQTLEGNSGGKVGPDGTGNINTVGTGSITVVGNPGTNTLTTELTGLTNHAVLVGAGTATITKVGPTANTGAVLQNNSGADPSYSTATYPSTTTINELLYSSSNNVVGQITASDNGVLISGTTGIPSWLANSGTPGYVLTANSGAPPSWQAGGGGSGITTIDGDTGSVTGSTVTFTGASSAGSSVSFDGSSATMTFNVTDANDNTFIGSGAGNASAVSNGADNNIALGFGALPAITSGGGNTIVGFTAGDKITTGTNNLSLGNTTLFNLVTGSNNVAIGDIAGNNYTGAESSNVCINNPGVTGDSHVIRIGNQGGTPGKQNTCYVAGITGTNVNGSTVIVDNSTGQIGVNGISNNSGQPAFLAYLSASTGDVTGDGTYVFVPFDTVLFDQGSNFNTGSNYYKCPVAGLYQYNATVILDPSVAGSNTVFYVQVVVNSAYGYYLAPSAPFTATSGVSNQCYSGSVLIQNSANDEVQIQVQVAGNASKNIEIVGGAGGAGAGSKNSTFSGYLVC